MSAVILFSHGKILSGKQATLFLAVLHAPLATAAKCHTDNQFSRLPQSYKNRDHPNQGISAQGLVSGVAHTKKALPSFSEACQYEKKNTFSMP